ELAARWLLVRNLDLLPGMAARLMQEDEAEPGVSSPGEPLSLVPFDPHKAGGLMIGLKHAGTPRPSREDAQTPLSGVFRDVSRDKAEAVVKIVWGEGKRGR